MNNTVELLGFYGSDITHACSGWVIKPSEMTEDRRARIPQFLKQLAEGTDGNEHGTPFEKSFLHFIIDTEVASHIHALKHRIGVSVNAESARYRELKEGRYYMPGDWPTELQQELEAHYRNSESLYHRLCGRLAGTLGRKRAKESARFALPYGHMLRADIAFNFRSFLHFQKLRNAEHAQDEIEDIAQRMLELVRETGAFKFSLEAWGY